MPVNQHRPISTYYNRSDRPRSHGDGPPSASTLLAAVPHARVNAEQPSTLDDIAATAARLTDLLDDLRTREPVGGLSGPNPTLVTLDQAAAAAADLHSLVAGLASGRS